MEISLKYWRFSPRFTPLERKKTTDLSRFLQKLAYFRGSSFSAGSGTRTHVPLLILGLFPTFSDRLARKRARKHQKKAPISEGQ
jgi:hypothetical protein